MSKSSISKLIVAEDIDYLLINKPPKNTSISQGLKCEKSFVRDVKKYFPASKIVYNISENISGGLLFAKNSTAFQHFSQQVRKKSLRRIYHIAVDDIHKFEDEIVKSKIYSHSKNHSIIDKKKGVMCSTSFSTLEYFWKHTLISCEPFNQKRNQVQLHAQQVKAPIIGDLQYGGSLLLLSSLKKKYRISANTIERPLIRRPALHLFKVIFKNLNGDEVNVEFPYPKDFKGLLYQLKKTNPIK